MVHVTSRFLRYLHLIYMWALVGRPRRAEVRVAGGAGEQARVTSYTQGIDSSWVGIGKGQVYD